MFSMFWLTDGMEGKNILLLDFMQFELKKRLILVFLPFAVEIFNLSKQRKAGNYFHFQQTITIARKLFNFRVAAILRFSSLFLQVKFPEMIYSKLLFPQLSTFNNNDTFSSPGRFLMNFLLFTAPFTTSKISSAASLIEKKNQSTRF